MNCFKLEFSLEMYVDYSNNVETNQYNWIWRMKRKLNWMIVVFSLKYEWKTQKINFKDSPDFDRTKRNSFKSFR